MHDTCEHPQNDRRDDCSCCLRRERDRLNKASMPIADKRAYNAKWRANVPDEWRVAKRQYNRERQQRLVGADPLYHAKKRAKNPERSRELDMLRYERDKPKRIALATMAGERRRARLHECKTFRFTERDWKALKRRHGERCFYCGAQAKLQKDHVIPIARGGDHSVGNIVPSCRPCNLAKLHRTVMEWRMLQLRLSAAA